MKKLLGISPLIGTVITIILVNIAWDKNPNGEIHSQGIIHWETILPIILSSWILSTLASFAALFASYLLYRFFYHVYLYLSRNHDE